MEKLLLKMAISVFVCRIAEALITEAPVNKSPLIQRYLTVIDARLDLSIRKAKIVNERVPSVIFVNERMPS